MNRIGKSLVGSMLLLGLVPLAEAQQSGTTAAPGAAGRGVVVVDHAQARARVEAIDYANRTVVLKGEKGNTITLKVGPQAKNFDQVKVGDQVLADFYTSTAIFLRKSDEPPSAGTSESVELAAPGEQPHGVITRTHEITARVDAVDVKNRTVTVTGPEGNTETFKVGDAVQHLDRVKKGDQVVVQYTEAVALRVEKT